MESLILALLLRPLKHLLDQLAKPEFEGMEEDTNNNITKYFLMCWFISDHIFIHMYNTCRLEL